VSSNDTGSDGDAGPADTVRRVTGTGVPVRGNDVDTDEIVPARFLKVVTFDGLGQFAFFDERFDSATPPEASRDGDGEKTVAVDDRPLEHPFNAECFQGASVLAVNANFGCGSSREHAPQALMRWGIDAVVGESFAEIFAGNCLALGIPTVTASREDVEALQDYIDEHPDADIEVDVEAEEVRYGDTTVDASVDDAHRRALVDGVWDTTALMGANADSVEATAASLPYTDD